MLKEKKKSALQNTNAYKVFSYLFVGLMLICLMSAGQFYFIADEREDIREKKWTNFFEVEIDQARRAKETTIEIDGKIFPLLNVLPPIFAFVISAALFIINSRKLKIESDDQIAPNAQYFVVHSCIFGVICIGSAMFEKSFRSFCPHFSYGYIPAVYHTVLAVVIGIVICVDDWRYYKLLAEKVERLRPGDIDNYRQYIERVLKFINRSTLILLISLALGTWKILEGRYENLPAIEINWHTNEIVLASAICCVCIVYFLLIPLFKIFQLVDLVYFKTLEAESAADCE